MRKKKLLFINSSGFYRKKDGLYIYHETAKLLQELDEVFAVESCHYELLSWSTDNLANYNLSDTSINISPFKRYKNKVISYIISYAVLIGKLLSSDFLYLFYPNSFKFTALFAILFNKKYALYVRGEKGIQSRFSKFIFKRASFILTVSPKFTKDIALLNSRVQTIKPMIAYSTEDLILEKTPNDKLQLLYVGRVERAKGTLELIYSIEKLVSQGISNFKLTVVGNGELLASLREYVLENDLTNFIDFKGAVYDSSILKEIYKCNDIFVLPTHHEGFPRVLYEAMIFRLAIITTFVGSIPNLMQNKHNCLQIKVDQYTDIASKLSILLQDKKLLEQLKVNGTETIQEYLLANDMSHADLIKLNFFQ